jgi:hypothetical protein
MNHLNNFQGYVIGLKKSGLHKGDMIDYICGIFNNMATRNDCLAFVLKYINPKQPEKIINETDLRRLLRKSEDNVLREMFALAQERYLHVSRYRDDKVNQYDQTLSQIEKAKKLKNLTKENLDTANLGSNVQPNINIKQISSDLVNRLGDLETHLKDLVSANQINISQDQFDAISKLESITDLAKDLEPILETLKTIQDNKTKLLVLNANMYLGKLIKESNGL